MIHSSQYFIFNQTLGNCLATFNGKQLGSVTLRTVTYPVSSFATPGPSLDPRQASGIQFYLRRNDASNRTVAFAFNNGWLVVATRDDLIASTLALIARQPASSLAGEAWYVGAVARAGNPGELRMALNIQTLISDVRFRSYWIQLNVSELLPFQAEIADVRRTPQEIEENRILRRDVATHRTRKLSGRITRGLKSAHNLKRDINAAINSRLSLRGARRAGQVDSTSDNSSTATGAASIISIARASRIFAKLASIVSSGTLE